MNIEEQLEQIILDRYKSIKDFSRSAGIVYTTLRSIIEKRGTGLSKASVQTVIRIFDALDLDMESIQTGTLAPKKECESKMDAKPKLLLRTFKELNEEGQNKLCDYAEDLVQSGRYKKTPAAEEPAQEIG